MRPRTRWIPLPYSFALRDFSLRGVNMGIVSMAWPAFTPVSQVNHPPQRCVQSVGPYGFKASHWAIRELLSQQVQGRIPPERWVLTRSSQGRPEVVGPEPGFHVSIAYAGDICAVAATQHRPVGIDLEAIPYCVDDDLPTYLLSQHETWLVRYAPGIFVTIWTLKEALAKEIGEGLMGDATAIETASYALAPSGTLKDRPDGGAVFHDSFRLGDSDYALALTLGPPSG
ncbi:4'-phosphopantetheinyl transferase superfamily protein [Halomonas sp. TRM85114]|uniref:4'-phosphopantetheinyl transferase family protein n=1 Tax=Halomonas jincaotanensis TaxID=2810616 RepID=UPI001BD5C1CD|nr:4'-phosphopantetheinyl transferase superfamily protein [Halomonas jincaotanensis]MBS9402757.1 4'-phosphopantetheinyl transferase superfamily protein [Halomonas jincaotanensis]